MHRDQWLVITVDYKTAFSQLNGDTTVTISSFMLCIDSMYFLAFADMFILLVQAFQYVVVGTSGDICELQKVFKRIFMP